MYYDDYYDDGPDTMGSFNWGGLINTGVQLGVGFLQSLGQSSTSHCMKSQVSGDQAMGECIPFVMSQFDNLQAQLSFMSPSDAIASANQIAGIFSNPQYFNQSVGGRSQELREAAKVEARRRADAIIALATAATQQQATNPAATGTPTATGIQIDTQTVLIIGGGLMALLFLLKR